MMTIHKMKDLDLNGKRVLIRADLNVPIKRGVITSDARIVAALVTIKHALAAGAGVILMSHLGRPVEGKFDPQYSLVPVAQRLGELLKRDIEVLFDWDPNLIVVPGQIIMLENCRFSLGETINDPALSQRLARLCDIFVMDAFGTAHRAHASTYGVAESAPIACAGTLLVNELTALELVLEQPKKPTVAIVGGAKVSSKLTVLNALSTKVDQLIVGGGIANTFLAAAGYPIGKSLYEPSLIEEAKKLMDLTYIPLPTDVVVASEFSDTAIATVKAVEQVKSNEMILDIGPTSAAYLSGLLEQAKTIIWNGPVGVFEIEQFSAGTKAIAEAIASSDAFSIAGGGDTLAAIEQFNIESEISYISTGGGAFLEFIQGKTLPAVAMLKQCKAKSIVNSRENVGGNHG
jgi:phosphoglycerate kinase